MSRALNVTANQAHVIKTCGAEKATITAIETLRSGGTRVVVQNSVQADALRRIYGKQVLNGPVQREPTRLQHS